MCSRPDPRFRDYRLLDGTRDRTIGDAGRANRPAVRQTVRVRERPASDGQAIQSHARERAAAARAVSVDRGGPDPGADRPTGRWLVEADPGWSAWSMPHRVGVDRRDRSQPRGGGVRWRDQGLRRERRRVGRHDVCATEQTSGERPPAGARRRSALPGVHPNLVEEGGCGDFGLRDVGVYLRTKSLPNGEWSEPTQIGAVADHVQSLRVVDGTIHATVANEADGRRYYETQRGDQYRRYEILNAVGEVALRIGDDGRARVAYEAADAIWYGTFTAGNLTAVKVTGTSRGYRPVLVLGAGDQPFLMWNRGWHDGGCTEPGPLPEDGTWFSTLVGGTWRSEQLTSSQNAASLTVDVGAGRVHAVIDDRKVVYMTKAGSGPWSRQTLGDQQPQEAVIRLDPKGGGLLVTFVAWVDDAERVFVVTHD